MLDKNLIDKFTLNGKMELRYNYRDDSTPEVQAEINQNFILNKFNDYLIKIKNRESLYYGMTDQWLYEALEKYPIYNKEVCIFGSANPWYEAMVLEFGCSNCHVIEYSDRKSFDSKIVYTKPHDKLEKKFPIGFSISSWEHDGLTRYGDPLNPNGDLEAIKLSKNIIEKGGILFFAVPVGVDTICWNVHRIYGNIRLPMMLEGWKILDTFGMFEGAESSNINNEYGTDFQPIFVLQNI